MSVGIETAFSERSQLAMVRPLIKQAARCFDVPIFQVEEALSQAPHADALAAFCRAGGPQKLLIYMQPPGEDAEDDEEPLIYVSSGESDRFVERGVLLAKASAELELTSANVESEVSCNVVLGSPMKALLASIEQVYLPVLTASVPAWGAKLPEDVAPEFFGGIGKFVAVLADAVHGVEGGVELVKPSVRADNVDPKQKGFERAASNPELVASYEAAVLAWCDTVEELLDDVCARCARCSRSCRTTTSPSTSRPRSPSRAARGRSTSASRRRSTGCSACSRSCAPRSPTSRSPSAARS